MAVVLDRDGGDLDRTRRLGSARFERAVRREITRRGGQKPCLRIVRKLLHGAGRPGRGARPPPRRPGAGAAGAGGLGRRPSSRLAETEHRMVAVLDELGLTSLATTHPRDQRGRCGRDPGRDRRPAPVRHRPGPGQARRPGTTGEAVRAPSPAGPSSPARADPDSGSRPGARSGARCRPTPSTPPGTDTSPPASTNKLKPTQAQTVIAAAILRHLHAVITTGQAWDPDIATARHQAQRGHPGRLSPSSARGGHHELTVGASPTRHRGPPSTSTHIMGSPARRRHNPITRCRAPAPFSYAGTDDGRRHRPKA